MKHLHAFNPAALPAGRSRLITRIIISLLLLACGYNLQAQALKITGVEFNYPCPAIPYYYLKADLVLPSASMIEVELSVDGKPLRYTDLRPEHDPGDLLHPHVTNRPPSGSGLSQDNVVYQSPRCYRLGEMGTG